MSAPIHIPPQLIRALLRALRFIPLLCPILASADTTLSSPIGGYCRIGRFTPVEVARNVADSVLIEGEGFFPVQLPAGASETLIVPILMVTAPSGTINVRRAGGKRAAALPFRVLSENERLVGLIGSAKANDAQFLFPDKQILGVALDRSRPLPGPLAAWEVLDAIICDSTPMPSTNRADIRMLLGSGIAIAVRSPHSPDDRWPWLQEGEWWVLKHDPIGPRTVTSEPAYLPVQDWRAATSVSAPVMVIGFGLLSVVGVLTALVIRNRFFRLAGGIAFAFSLAGFIYCWSRRLPLQHEAAGTIAYFSGGLVQHDFWEYRSPHSGGVVSCVSFRQGRHASSPTRPVLMSAQQASRQAITLEVDAIGEPQVWIAHLKAGEKVAFLTRFVDPHPSKHTPHSMATDSPLQSLARAAYTSPGVRVIGQGYPRTDRRDGFVEVFLKRDH